MNANHTDLVKFGGPKDSGYKKLKSLVLEAKRPPLYDDAYGIIRGNTYNADNLEIERLSGETLNITNCYINLAIINFVDENLLSEREKRGMWLGDHLGVKLPDRRQRVDLASLFCPRGASIRQGDGPRRIFIRGRAGVGKTTLCKRIVYEVTHEKLWADLFDRVLWIPLRRSRQHEASKPIRNLEDLLYTEFFSTKIEGRKLARALCSAVEDSYIGSKTLFILDGLDEIDEFLKKDHTIHAFIKELLCRPHAGTIITSRPGVDLPSRNSIKIDLELETIGFYPEQQSQYITSVAPKEKADQIQKFLHTHPRVQLLVRIPIQLDAVCFTWDTELKRTKSHLSETMTELYRAIELNLWKERDLRRLIPHGKYNFSSFGRKRVEKFIQQERACLEFLAFSGLYDQLVEFDANFRTNVTDTSLFLDKKINLDDWEATFQVLSFLRTSDPSKDPRDRLYHFIHLTFQEYFAASYFVQHWLKFDSLENATLKYMDRDGEMNDLRVIDILHKHKYSSRFDVFWRFVAGHLNAADRAGDFFDAVEQDGSRDLLGPTHLRLVMRCLAEVSPSISQRERLHRRLEDWWMFQCKNVSNGNLALEDEFPVEMIVSQLKQRGNVHVGIKESILKTLTQRSFLPEEVFYAIMSQLEQGNDAVRGLTMKSLKFKVSLPKDIEKQIERLVRDEDGNVRKEVPPWLKRTAYNVLFIQRGRQPEREKKKRQKKAKRPQEATAICLTPLIESHKNWQNVPAWLEPGDDMESRVEYIVEALEQQEIDSTLILQQATNHIAHDIKDIREACTRVLRTSKRLPEEHRSQLVALLQRDDTQLQQRIISVLAYQAALSPHILHDVTKQLRHHEYRIQLHAAGVILPYDNLLETTLRDMTSDFAQRTQKSKVLVLRILGHQKDLPSDIMEILTDLVEENSPVIGEYAFRILLEQEVDIGPIFRRNSLVKLHTLLLHMSWKEQVSLTIVGAETVSLNTPSCTREVLVGNVEEFRKRLEDSSIRNTPKL